MASKSIRTKLLRIVIVALVLMAVVMGSVAVLLVNRLAGNNSERIMTRICSEQTFRLDGNMDIVHHSTEMFYEYLMQVSEGEYTINYEQLNMYEKNFEDLALTIANETKGAMAVYFRYDPELSGNGTSGFFWTRNSDNEEFSRENPTDILAYPENDIEHVGWFYIPKENGKPLWMTPYYNDNIDVFMISYVIPIFLDDGTFVGVIGMDIDFGKIIDATGNGDFFDDGSIVLVDMNGKLMYYTDENGKTKQAELSDRMYDYITEVSESDSHLKRIKDDSGKRAMICCNSLSNGMVLYVNVPLKDIYSERNRLISFFVIVAVVILLVTFLAVSGSAYSIINPIRKLSEITGRYAEGDWSVKYINYSSKEIGKLSEDISVMAENTQEYIRRLDSLARKDALTGIGNKTAYVELVEEIRQNHKGKFNHYEVFVMDLNLLKKANDNLGHEAGDALLKEAGRYIGKTFRHSPVFRIGGDEFVAILLNEDYENRAELTRQFEKKMGYIIPGEFRVQLYISFGGAIYGEEGTDYDELFKIADDRMYQKKKEMKMERKD